MLTNLTLFVRDVSCDMAEYNTDVLLATECMVIIKETARVIYRIGHKYIFTWCHSVSQCVTVCHGVSNWLFPQIKTASAPWIIDQDIPTCIRCKEVGVYTMFGCLSILNTI